MKIDFSRRRESETSTCHGADVPARFVNLLLPLPTALYFHGDPLITPMAIDISRRRESENSACSEADVPAGFALC